MPTSLTDQLFGVKEESLSDQLAKKNQGSLTDQMFAGELTTKLPTTDTAVEIPVDSISIAPKDPAGLMREYTERMTKTFKLNDPNSLGIDDQGKPIENLGLLYKVGTIAAETLEGIVNLPEPTKLGVLKGGLDVALSIPGFMIGLVDAGASAVKETLDQVVLGGTFNLEDIYNSASKGMQRSMEFFEPGKELLIGKPSPDSEVMSQVLMAPMTGLSMTGHAVANSDSFKDYPNIRGAARFAGDIAGIIAMGGILHGKSERAKFTKDVKSVVKKAEEVATKEKDLESVPNELIKQTQKKVLDIEKTQLELEAAEISKRFSKDVLIREELALQAETLAKEKIRPVQDTGLKVPEVKEVKTGESLTDQLKIKHTKPVEPITDIDIATESKPVVSEGVKSPFFQDLKKTSEFADIYLERQKAVQESPEVFTQKLINDVNQWYHKMGDIPIDQVRQGLSNLASNADSLRAEFITGRDHLIWKETVQEAATWARRLDRFEIERTTNKAKKLTEEQKIQNLLDLFNQPQKPKSITRKKDGVRLTSGIDPVQGAKAIVQLGKDFSASMKRDREFKKFNPRLAAKTIKNEFIRSFVDRSGNIRTDLLDKLGDEGYKVIQKMYLAKGSSTIASNYLKQMQKEVYAGLTRSEKKVLDGVILADRMVDIAKYKTEKQFKFPKGKGPKESTVYANLFGEIEGISAERASVIRQRAQGYFEWMKKPLDDMLKADLITPEEYTALSSHNYRKIKILDIFDRKSSKLGKRGRTVYDSGVEALSRGRDTDIFEPSSEIMALEVFNRAYGRIMNNEANKALLDVAKSDPQNPFVRLKESKEDRIPTGWQRSYVYEKGERKAMYLSPEMSKEWVTSNPETTYKLSQVLRYSSGSPVLRTFATGINWGFAMANLPRDIMHTWFAARQFKDGEWSGVYNPTAPVFGLHMGVDLTSTFPDAMLRKGRYQDYINEGGGMEFLTHQGRLFQKGRHLESPVDKVFNFMGYLGETSEIMTRLSIRDRVIKNRAKEQGITVNQARKNKDITREATFATRDYMDFGQGGGIAKALDNGLPYFNAAIQGSRGLFRSFQPGSGTALSSTFKLAQFASIVTGLTIATSKLAPDTMKNLEGNIASENNIIIPLGDEFGFEDNNGQIRYPYLKIPLDPGQKFFKTFFEASTNKWLGKEIDVGKVVSTLKEQSPVGISSLPPTISGTLGYISNKDFWLNEDIVRQPFSFPQSKEEYSDKTPEFYKDLGQFTGLSPERSRYAIEELITSGTVWSYLAGQGYEAFKGMPKDMKEKHLAEVLSKTPISKRFIGITNPYSKHASKIEKAEEETTLKRFVENRNFDTLVDGYLYKDIGVGRKDVIDMARSYKDKDTYDRLIDRFKFEQTIKYLPEKSFWRRMKGLPLEAKAQVFVDRLKSSSPEQEKQLWKEYAIIARAKGVISKDFRREVSRLRGED